MGTVVITYSLLRNIPAFAEILLKLGKLISDFTVLAEG